MNDQVNISRSTVPLAAVISTAMLGARPSRPPDYEAESHALVTLAQQMAHAPHDILQRLVEAAVTLCGAGSSGVSIIEDDGSNGIFRWHALTGALAGHLGGTTPRNFSPCGTVVDNNATMLMSLPERHFTYFNDVKPLIVEALLVPFAVNGKATGTIWVVTHDDSHHFDAEDARLMTSLGTFTAAAYQVRSSLEQVRESSRRKDSFLAMLGHELRSPLAPIRNVADVLRRTIPGDATHERLCTMLDRQMQHMARLVDDLLDVSRVALDKIQFRREALDLHTVIARALDSSRALIDSKDQHLSLSLPEEALGVMGDSTRLIQALGNLLDNASKYTPVHGSISLEVTCDNREIELRVRDTGIGVAPEMLPKIFELFAQADHRADHAYGGLGIGLSLVRTIIEHHGGNVTAKSEGPGRGSEILVRLPRHELAPASVPVGAIAPSTNRSGSPSRILIVDDNEDAAESMAMLLRMNGHEVTVAADGQSALDVAQRLVPSLILLDIALPGMDGFEVARRLRQGGCVARLVAITGYGQSEDRKRSSAAGFDHHLVKPVDPRSLEDLVL